MVGVPLPECEPKAVERRLFDEHRIEVLVQTFSGTPVMRISFQGYNDETDLERLVAATCSIFEADGLRVDAPSA